MIEISIMNRLVFPGGAMFGGTVGVFAMALLQAIRKAVLGYEYGYT